MRHAPTGPVAVTVGALGDQIELRIVDRGPGVPVADRERVFAPFQRLGDTPAGQGVGLGLAVARGLPRRWAARSPRRTPPAVA